ncbi:phospholipid scramblase family member 5-like [Ascaphus truei]|uniref:phospholipid scramblase family member 5-like n=1 Tax=Ascaphus truei TaxID=8439 RepID=UPI003F5A52DB
MSPLSGLQMEVCAGPGDPIGYVTLNWNAFVTHLSVMNVNKAVVLRILGPSFQTNVFGNVNFEVKSSDEQHVVGTIRLDNGEFTVCFPTDLEVTVKAALMAACFYVNALIAQRRQQLLHRSHHN